MARVSNNLEELIEIIKQKSSAHYTDKTDRWVMLLYHVIYDADITVLGGKVATEEINPSRC